MSIPWLRGVRDYGAGNMRVIIRSAWELCMFSAGNQSRRVLVLDCEAMCLDTPTKCKRGVCFRGL